MIPKREPATHNGQTYFVTSNTAERRLFFCQDRWSKLFLEVLYSYRPERYLLHGFVLMPDHFHILVTPAESLERAVQCLKGGFSFRAKKEFSWIGGVWVAGFSDHRIRDDEDFRVHLGYIERNPVKAKLVEFPQQHPYSSANGQFELDSFPQGLKPGNFGGVDGAAKAAPFQNKSRGPQVDEIVDVRAEARTLHTREHPNGAAKAAPFSRRTAALSEQRQVSDNAPPSLK